MGGPPMVVWTLVLERAEMDVLERCRWLCRAVRALADGDEHLWRLQLTRLLPTTPHATLLGWRAIFGDSWRRLCRHLWAVLQADALGRLPTLREIGQATGHPRCSPWSITVEAFRQGSWATTAATTTAAFYGLQVSADPDLKRRARIMVTGIPTAVRAGWLPRVPAWWRIPSIAAVGTLAFRPWLVVVVCNDSLLFVRIVGDAAKDTAEIMVAASLPTRVHTPTSLAMLTRPISEHAAAAAATAAPVLVAAVAVSFVVHLYDALTGAPLIWPERGMQGNVLETPRPIVALVADGRHLVASLDDGSLCLWPLVWFDQHRTRAADGVRVDGAAGLLAPLLAPPLHVPPARTRSLLPPVAVAVAGPTTTTGDADADVDANAEVEGSRDVVARVRVAYQDGELEWWAVGARRARVARRGPAPRPADTAASGVSPFGAGVRGRVWEYVDQTSALGPEILLVQAFSLPRPHGTRAPVWTFGDLLQPDPFLSLDHDAAASAAAAIDPLREPARYPTSSTSTSTSGGAHTPSSSSAAAAAANAERVGRRLRSLDELIVQAYGVPVDPMRAHGGVWSLPSAIYRAGPQARGPVADVHRQQRRVLDDALIRVDPAAKPPRAACPMAWRQLELRCWEGLNAMRRLRALDTGTDHWLPLSSVPWVRSWPAPRLLAEAHTLLVQEHAMPPVHAATAASRQRPARGGLPPAVLAALAPSRRGRNWLCVRVCVPKWDMPHLYIAWQAHTWAVQRAEARDRGELSSSSSNSAEDEDEDEDEEEEEGSDQEDSG